MSTQFEGAITARAENEPDMSLPTGVQLTPFDEHFRANPYPALSELRTRDPIHRDQQLQRWLITGYEATLEFLRNKEISVDYSKASPDSFAGRMYSAFTSSGMKVAVHSMFIKDDPDHRRL